MYYLFLRYIFRNVLFLLKYNAKPISLVSRKSQRSFKSFINATCTTRRGRPILFLESSKSYIHTIRKVFQPTWRCFAYRRIALLMERIVGEKKRTSCLNPLPLRNAIRQASHEWKDEGANKIGGALETGRITNLGDDDDVTREPHFIAAQNETLVAYLL